MSFSSVEKIATAILYEGYILYPYRPTSIKNRQRWNFGTLYPRIYAEAQRPHEPFRLVAECLIAAERDAKLDIKLRFLQLVRKDGRLQSGEGVDLVDPSLTWEEGVERTHQRLGLRLHELLASPVELQLEMDPPALPEGRGSTPDASLRIDLRIHAEMTADGCCKVRVEVVNETQLRRGTSAKREEALPQSLVAAHLLLGVSAGGFISMLEPPESCRDAVLGCENVGVFPVLVGNEPERSMMICSPIILYDYPQIAPESEGDFFDSTEMDEMLTLRVLTLTDAEKQEMRDGDSRARKILERTEKVTPAGMLKAHGVVRSLRRIPSFRETAIGEWNPFKEMKAPPESVTVFGVSLRVGDRVRLWPHKHADIMDMALKGKVAVIEAIEQDFEDQIQLAVVVDDDPGREFGMMRQPGHRFFYSPEEVEPMGAGDCT